MDFSIKSCGDYKFTWEYSEEKSLAEIIDDEIKENSSRVRKLKKLKMLLKSNPDYEKIKDLEEELF